MFREYGAAEEQGEAQLSIKDKMARWAGISSVGEAQVKVSSNLGEPRHLALVNVEEATPAEDVKPVEKPAEEAKQVAELEVKVEPPSAGDQIAAQMYSYHIGTAGVAESTKANNVILGSNGVFILKRLTINENKVKVLTKAGTKIPGLPIIAESVAVKVSNKIPLNILRSILGSFHAISSKMNTEAAAQVFKKPDGTIEIYYPEQEVSGASARYRNDGDAEHIKHWGESQMILEVHSHNTMGAFFSGTDNANERRPSIYGVFGLFGTKRASSVFRFRYEGLEKKLTLSDIFDLEGQTPEEALTLENLPAPSPILIERASRYKAPAASPYIPNIHRSFGRSALDDVYEGTEWWKDPAYTDYRRTGFYRRDELDSAGARNTTATTTTTKSDSYPITKFRKTKGSKAEKGKGGSQFDLDWLVSRLSVGQKRELILMLDDSISAEVNKHRKGDVPE